MTLCTDGSRLYAFKRNVIIQTIALLNILFTKEFLRAAFGWQKMAILTSEVIFMVGTTIYIISVYALLKQFTQNRFILNTILASFIIAFSVGCLIQNPFFTLVIEGKKYYTLLVQTCFSIGTFTVIFYTIKEIFDDDTTQAERLWGAACVYFMIAWAFGGVYDIIGILDNNALGNIPEIGTTLTYIEATAYSMSVLGNFNQLYEKVSPLMARVAVIEAVWAHLFVVLVVGRLLSK
jgi:hypothetical protein